MTDLAAQVYEDALRLARAQIELAERVEAAPRMVYLLWNGHTVLLGIFGTQAKADREMEDFLDHHPGADLWVESRVVHS